MQMTNYRFILEPYNRSKRNRYTCPSCGKKFQFSRYIDIEGSIEFPGYVGKCNRENKCGYHYSPSMYFDKNPNEREKTREQSFSPPTTKDVKPFTPEAMDASFIDRRIMEQSLRHYERNNLYAYLCGQLGTKTTIQQMQMYHVGTAKKWGNSTVFWQVDKEGRVHTGKVMLYNPNTGKRVKEPYAKISWVHTVLNLSSFTLNQCFFGEHLLAGNNKPVAIVESEKTAIIASAYIPNYIWLATGGKNGCFNEQHFDILCGRNVVLFPDIGMEDEWQKKAFLMRRKGINVILSDYLGQHASAEEKENGYDIADYLIKEKSGEAILQSMCQKNPSLKKMIALLNLELVDFHFENK